MQSSELANKVGSTGAGGVLSMLQRLCCTCTAAGLTTLQDDYPHSRMGKLRQGQWQLTATQQAGEHKEGEPRAATLKPSARRYGSKNRQA